MNAGSASVLSTDAPALSGAEPLASEYDLALSAAVTVLAADASSYDNPESLTFDPESLAFDPRPHPFESIRAELTALPLSLSSSIKQPALPAEIVPPSNSCQIYTLKPGDSCWLIARTNSITMEQLAAWNPDMSCMRLLIGQRVCVSPPSNSIGPSPTQPGNACREYVVKSGDSCWYIGASIGISLEQLQAYNPGLNCQGLQVGQRLCLPSGSSGSPTGSVTPTPTTPSIPVAPSSCKLYTVVSGDSCYDISLRTQVYLVDLLSPSINKLAPDDKGVCAWHRIRSGETCTSIGQPYGIG
ncbi:LysM-domain-containing protein, partial [Linderina pennispora]